MRPVFTGALLDTRKYRPYIRVSKNAPVYTGHIYGQYIRAVFTGSAALSSRIWVWNPVYTIQPVLKPVWQTVECLYTRYNRFSIPATTSCIVYTNIQPVVNPDWQPVVSCKQALRQQPFFPVGPYSVTSRWLLRCIWRHSPDSVSSAVTSQEGRRIDATKSDCTVQHLELRRSGGWGVPLTHWIGAYDYDIINDALKLHARQTSTECREARRRNRRSIRRSKI